MEIIKNYLESMFAKLPATNEVLRAKRELAQMMEDKYNSLKSEGTSENEAVATVISEFGNLEEIAEELGIDLKSEAFAPVECKMVTKDETAKYIDARKKYSMMLAGGILCCILSMVPPILISVGKGSDIFSMLGMFLTIAVGVVLIVMSKSFLTPFSYLREEPCNLDYNALNYVKEARNAYKNTQLLNLVIGILLCVFSWLPCTVVNEVRVGSFIRNGFGPALLFVMVGIGVFLIVQGNAQMNGYEFLLNLKYRYANRRRNVNTSYRASSATGAVEKTDSRKISDAENTSGYTGHKNEIEYENTAVDVLMHVFWPTMTCIYLIWSFITFDWWITWIVWPVAVAIHTGLKSAFRNYEK